MNRLVELTFQLLDDELGDAEFVELRAIVEADRAAADRFCRLLKMEAALRGLRETDLVESTMRRLDERLVERAEHRVMDAVWAVDAVQKQDATRTRGQTLRSKHKWVAATIAVATCGLLIVGLFWSSWFGKPTNNDLPVVVRTEGKVQLRMADGSSASMGVGQTVGFGTTLQAGSEDDQIVLRYNDGTEIELAGAGVLAVVRSADGGKRLRLSKGLMRADVAKQASTHPFMIETPHASVRVVGTRFELATGKKQGTRLDLESGRVELLRDNDSPVAVASNQIAVIPASADPIRVTSRPRLIEKPERSRKFRGLQSIEYSADGTTIVGASGSHAVFWHDDDRFESVPLAAQKSGKNRFKGQSGSFIVFEEPAIGKLTIWSSERREPAHVFDEYGKLPAQFTRRSHGRVLLPARSVLISPHGDWAAFHWGSRILVWDCRSNEWRDLGYRGKASAIAVSSDGRLLAIAGARNSVVSFFDVHKRQRTGQWRLPGSASPSALCYSADGKKLAVGYEGKVQVFDADSGDLQDTFHQDGVNTRRVALSADGRFLAAAGNDRKVRLWNVASGRELAMYRFKGATYVRDLDFSPNGRELAILTRWGRVTVWDVPPR